MIYMVIFQSCCALLDNTLLLFALEHFSTKKEDISQQTVFSFSWSKSKKSFIFVFLMSNNEYKISAYLEKILKILFSLALVFLEVKNSNFHKKISKSCFLYLGLFRNTNKDFFILTTWKWRTPTIMKCPRDLYVVVKCLRALLLMFYYNCEENIKNF